MTWTSTFGRACGVLLDAIVRWLALARINPNVLTFLGLVVNIVAAFLFGYANGENQARMFRYAGLVIIGSGFFDLVGPFLIRWWTATAMPPSSWVCWCFMRGATGFFT